MISNSLVQAALITKLKSITALVSELDSENEIKEDQWQGNSFLYPAVRVALGTQYPFGDPDCGECTASLSIQVFTEDGSSKNSDYIAGIINDNLYGKAFTSGGIRFSSIRSAGLIPAIRKDARTWQSEATFQMKFNLAS